MSILTGKFEIHANPPYTCEVTINSRGLVYRNIEDRKGGAFEKKVNISDIIGCHCLKERTNAEDGTIKKAAYFCIYTYPLHKKTFSLKTFRRYRNTVVFKADAFDTFEENLRETKKWKAFIAAAIRSNENLMEDVIDAKGTVDNYKVKPRKLLILVNPNSGPKKAKQLFNERVKPVLAEAGIQYDVIITERANHARDLVKEYNLFEWDGIIIVSGDGLIYEVVNGIMERPDWKEVLQVPLGIVPGGSGNGLARAISHSIREPYDSSNQMYNSMTSALNFIRGKVSHMDLVKVTTRNETIYSFLSIGWGLFADIDIESEKMRNWGEARFMMRAIVRIAGLRLYKGRLSYLPVEGYIPPVSASPSMKPRKLSMQRSNTVHAQSKLINGNDSTPVRLLKSHSVSADDAPPDHPASYDIATPDNALIQADGNLSISNGSGNTDDMSGKSDLKASSVDETDGSSSAIMVESEGAVDSDATDIVQDDASSVNSSPDNKKSVQSKKAADHSDKETSVHIPDLDQPVPDNWIIEEDEYVMVYMSSVTHVGSNICLAPDARLDDGIIWMVIVRGNVTRAQVVEFCMCLEDGRHINSDSCSVIPVRAVRLEPDERSSSNHQGYLTVDGEVIEYGPIQAGVLPAVARVMTR